MMSMPTMSFTNHLAQTTQASSHPDEAHHTPENHVMTALKACVHNIMTNYENLDSFPLYYLKTGYTDWDYKTIGLPNGTLTLLAGDANSGKTSLLCNLAQKIALKQQKAVGIISLRLTAEQLMMRMLSSVGGITISQLTMGMLTSEDWEKVCDTVKQLKDAPIFINDLAFTTTETLLQGIEKMVTDHDLALVAIDDFPFRHCATDRLTAAEISENFTYQLQQLARQLKIPIILTASVNNNVDKRQDPRPKLSDLSIHGNLVAATDMVAFLYRDILYFTDADKTVAELIIKKNNHGQIGTVLLRDALNQFAHFEGLCPDGD